MNGFLDCFEIIWETIHEKYFDPTFGGLDWHEVHDRYQPHITAVHDEKTFYAFIPTVHELFRAALTDLRDTQALIIDIRGNHGGVWPIRKKLAENLVNEPALFCSYYSRECIQEIFLKPVENPYSGPLAVLVDVLSMSSAENLLERCKRFTVGWSLVNVLRESVLSVIFWSSLTAHFSCFRSNRASQGKAKHSKGTG